MRWFLLAQDSIDPTDPQTWVTAGLLVCLLAIFAADKILAHLKVRGVDLHKMYRRIAELHEWHDHEDPEQPGVKIWWNQKYLVDTIKDTAVTQKELFALLKEMREEQKRQNVVQEKQITLLAEMIKSQEALQRKLEKE